MIRAFIRCCSASVTRAASPWSAHEPLEERDAEPARLRRGREDGGRQLEVVAREHRPVGAEEREVERRLRRLRRLVHDREVEAAPARAVARVEPR